MFDLAAFVKESNDIEGIYGFTDSDIGAHEHFLNLERIRVSDLEYFVSIVQPGAVIRDQPGMDVRVDDHIPMAGGPKIVEGLEALLIGINKNAGPFESYCAYEYLHPFMDGNGRSGRAIWLWVMAQRGKIRHGTLFLPQFHYQSLDSFGMQVKQMLANRKITP